MSGLYVASNTQSIGAQLQLQRNIAALGDVLTRLSTGLRINSGKDDPAGLIAGELLRSDITASKQAIQNTQRANSIIAVADSALGQISSLLNDIRVLVNASANTGAMTFDQIQANQLQVDASIDSIDRISKTTQFQGMNLLDGFMDFSTSGVNAGNWQLDGLNIHSANFGTATEVDVNMHVKALGEKAQLFFSQPGISQDVYVEIGGTQGKQALRLSAGSTVADIAKQINMYTDSTGIQATVGREATQGQILITSVGLNNDINLKAANAGFDFGNYAVKFTAGTSAGPNVVITEPVAGKTGVIDIQLQMEPWRAAAAYVDESQLGIYARNFTVISETAGTGANTTVYSHNLNITSTNGTDITSINFIPSSGSKQVGSPLATTNVAIDLDSNGVMHVEYLAGDTPYGGSGLLAATWQDIIDAINKLDGVSASLVLDTEGVSTGTGATGMGLAALTGTKVSEATTSVATVVSGGKVNGTGTKTNNSINITAAVSGSSMNGTDIVYVKNVIDDTAPDAAALALLGLTVSGPLGAATAAKITITDGTDNIAIESKIDGSVMNDVTVKFVADSKLDPNEGSASYDVATKTLTISGNGTAVLLSDITGALLGAGFAGLFDITGGPTLDFSILGGGSVALGTYDGTAPAGTVLTGSNGATITSGAAGADEADYVIRNATTNAVVEVVSPAYEIATLATAQEATIGIGTSPTNGLLIKANETGSQWNGVKINIIEDTSLGDGARVSYDSKTKTLTITGNGTVGTTGTSETKLLAELTATGLFNGSVGAFSFTNNNGLTAILGSVNDVFSSSATGALNSAEIYTGKTGGDAGDIVVLNENGFVVDFMDAVTYSRVSQQATSTVFDGTNYITFTAGASGASYNGMNIKIEDVSNPTGIMAKYANNIVASYNAERNELHIIGDLQNATYTQLMEAVKQATKGDVVVTISSNIYGTAAIDTGIQKVGNAIAFGPDGSNTFELGGKQKTTSFTAPNAGQVVTSKVGTDHGAIIVNAYVGAGGFAATSPGTKAIDVVNAINADSSNIAVAATTVDGNGQGFIFNLTDPDALRVFSGAMQGGSSGYNSVMTANEVIDFINNHPILQGMFRAERANGNDGTGLVTLFQEVAYYGDVNLETALQFLGPKDSGDIEFRIDKTVIQNSNGTFSYKNVANSPLYITWEDDPVVKADASLTATNANAAFLIAALQPGLDYNDVAVQFIRQNSVDYAQNGIYATYEAGQTNAVAYCSIVSDKTGSNEEVGKFILTATGKGENFNNVNIKAQVNNAQTEAATVSFDAKTKTLMITLRDGNVTLSEAMAAIEKDGTFTADFDYSFNTNPYDNPGMTTFERLLGTGGTGAQNFSPVTIGNTGVTGSHTGGIIKVYLGGEKITANDAITAINNSEATRGLFSAGYYLGSDGTGEIDFRGDTLTSLEGDCGGVTDFRMVTGLEGKCPTVGSPRMVVHLATDEYGNSITTARDLVKYFETLTAEETRGISVSLIRPAGVDNVSDLDCIDTWGKGLLQETGYFDDCYNYFSDPIKFISANQDEVLDYARGQITAINGHAASYTLYALNAGSDFDGVSIVYQNIPENAGSEYVDYNSRDKILTIYIREGATTANQVKQLIESSENTRNLFRVELADGAGNGLVTTRDDAVSLRGGIRLLGEAGGAWMLGNADEDAHSLVIESVNVGSGEKVFLRVIEGNFRVTNAAGFVTDTATGKDAVVTLNGQVMTAKGNYVSVNNTMLSLDATLSGNVKEGDHINFAITGGGATFQLGPDVVSSQQIRIALPNVGSANLGGVSGKLYQLRSGEVADLFTDTKLADRIVQEAISAIATTRGRLGAIQRSTLEPNQAVLEDTIEQLSAAEALIFNADFAEESSKMARFQVLVQAGTQVLALTNQIPQYAAQLLRG